MITSLAQQFEAQCQLACGRSSDGVPDYNAILNKIKADFVHNSISSTAAKPYSMWLSSRTNKSVTEVAITEPFNLIAASDTSSWLQSTTAPQTMDTSTSLSLWLHSSSAVRSEPAEVHNTRTNMSSWLSPSLTKLSQGVQQQQDWVTRRSEGISPLEDFNTIAATSASSWLSPSADDKPQSIDTADYSSWLHSSNDSGNTFDAIFNSDSVLWLQQAKDHDYAEWLCNKSSQYGRCK